MIEKNYTLEETVVFLKKKLNTKDAELKELKKGIEHNYSNSIQKCTVAKDTNEFIKGLLTLMSVPDMFTAFRKECKFQEVNEDDIINIDINVDNIIKTIESATSVEDKLNLIYAFLFEVQYKKEYQEVLKKHLSEKQIN